MTDRERTDAEHNIIVIGTGNTGTAMAREYRNAGWNVAIVDEHPYGGTCAQRGCIPKKVLAGAAEVNVRSRGIRGKGVSGDLLIDWNDLMRFKRSITDPVPVNHEAMYIKKGITLYHGHTRFTGPNSLQIGNSSVIARFIRIATGAVPPTLGIPGEEYLNTSDDFLAVDRLLERIVFIGGGFISFELGHIAACAGADVTILHRSGQVLKEFDPFLVGLLIQVLRRAGIEVLTDMPVRAIEQSSDQLLVRAGPVGDGMFEADMVVHGAGRLPNTAGLDLERGGISSGKFGIDIDSYM